MLRQSIDLVEERRGRRPTGYVAPWWEFSSVTNRLLLENGIKYDHSLMHDDFHPYYVRVGDAWTKIDYRKPAEEWMKPLVRGEETDLVEIPANWYLDDLPPMMFIKSGPEQPRLRQPARHRADVARPVRLGLPRVRLRGVHDDDPPRRQRPAAGAAHATSGSSSTSTRTRACAG